MDMLEEKLIILKRNLVEYAAHVENMIEESTQGLVMRDRSLLDKVVREEEQRANDYEIDIEEDCVNLIAQFEPKAKDLRTILMILKMNNDLERMGDHAVNIAESAMYLIERPQVKELIDIPRMTDETMRMLKNSIDAFIREDIVLAREVCEHDSIVDNLRDQITRELITYMTSDPMTIERALKLISIARNLERIADLSTNIGEDVIFMVKGRVIKHHFEERESKPEEEL